MRQCARGFTLLEVLLVVVIAALASAAVVSTLVSRSGDEAKKHASAAFHRLQLLNEEAMLAGKDYGLWVDEKRGRYRLVNLTAKGWQLLDDSQIPAETELGENLALRLTMGSSAWQDEDRLFRPGSLFDDDRFADIEEKDALPTPQVFIMSSGEVSPFELAIAPKASSRQWSQETAWRVIAKENGQIVLLAPGESDE